MFDPYHKWLGIPKNQRPPTHYQLLGVSPDEADEAVIDAASVRQTAYVRNFQASEHAGDCNRILNELALARLTLLNPERRARYDAQIAPKPTPATIPTPPTPAPPATAASIVLPVRVPTAETSIRLRPTKPVRRGSFGPLISGLALSGLLAAGMGYFGIQSILINSPRAGESNRSQSSKSGPRELTRDEAIAARAARTGVAWNTKARPARSAATAPSTSIGTDPAVYEISIIPLDATVQVAGMPPKHREEGDRHFFEFPKANGSRRVRFLGSREGYKSVEREAVPRPGEKSRLIVRLAPLSGARESEIQIIKEGAELDRPPTPGDAKAPAKLILAGDVPTTRKETRKLEGHDGEVTKVAFSANGTRILTAGTDDALRYWDTATGKLVTDSLKGPFGGFTGVAFLTLKGQSMAVTASKDRYVRLWDLKAKKMAHRFEQHEGEIACIAVSPTGRLLLSSEADLLHFGDLKTFASRKVPTSPRTYHALAFSRDGRLVVAAASDQTVHVLDTETGTNIVGFDGHTDRIEDVAIAPSGLVASGSRDGSIRIEVIKPRKTLRILDAGDDPITSVAFSPDGRLLASGGDRSRLVRLWDVETGKEVRRFEGHSGGVTSVAYSPDGFSILSGSRDKTARLWEAPK